LAAATVPACERAYAAEEFLLLKLDGAYVKWGEPVLGTGATVRYALIIKDMNFSGVRNCAAMVPLEPALRQHGIPAMQLQTETAAAFAMWERAANIRFERTADVSKADILIGGQLVPNGRAFANVSFKSSEQGATRRIDKSLICLNQNQPWKIGFGGNPDAYDLRYTFAHEIGHAIGLNHPGPSGQLMGFKYAESFRALQPGDLDGAIALYGNRDGTTAATVAPRRTPQPAEMGLR
jgi:hypothetical protein